MISPFVVERVVKSIQLVPWRPMSCSSAQYKRFGWPLATWDALTRNPGAFVSIDDAGTELAIDKEIQFTVVKVVFWLKVLPKASLQFRITECAEPEGKFVAEVYLMVLLG